MAQAFRSARRLARRHCIGLALYLKKEQLAQRLELAWRIVSKLEEKGPLNQRDLVRCIFKMRRAVLDPVVGALTGLGVLVWGEDDKLELGDTEISEVEDRLREALLALVPASDTSLRKAAKSKPPVQSQAQTPPESGAETPKEPA